MTLRASGSRLIRRFESDQQLLLQLATAGTGDINVTVPNPTPTIRAIATPNARTNLFTAPSVYA